MSDRPVFKRKIYSQMLSWKSECNGTRALLIEGAHHVGKTTMVLDFASREYESYLYIDFTKADKITRDLFMTYSEDYDTLFQRLQLKYRTSLVKRGSVIIFDEVQAFPEARQMIKHLVADGRYDYIETGSLISIRQNVDKILIPSEERRIRMHPMDFEEFLWAQGDDVTVPLLRQAFESRTPLGHELHKMVMSRYATYMLVGGMPQAVETLIGTNDYSKVEATKRDILDLYAEDMSKIDRDQTAKARNIFLNIPGMLSKHEKSFSPSSIRTNSRTREYMNAVTWLRESRIVNVCLRCTDPGPALGLSVDEMSFKLYMLDTGLLFTSSFQIIDEDWDEVYEQFLGGRYGLNKGMFMENMVAQTLVASGHPLYFCRFRTKGSDKSHEVDFLMSSARSVVPIECKSGQNSTQHASLDRFMEKYSEWVGPAYVVHMKDLRTEGGVTYVPIYMSMFL